MAVYTLIIFVNKEIDRTHKRALRILYEDYESSFETLLARSGSNSMHIKNLQKLMTEIYKSMNQLNPSIVWEFHEKKPIMYNLKIQTCVSCQELRHLALDSIHCLFEVVSYGTLLMTVSNKYQLCHILKRGSKIGQQIDAPVKYVADYKYYFFYFCIYYAL